jgi:hypothetical protein
MTRQGVHRVETADAEPSIGALRSLSRALGLNECDLLKTFPERFTPPARQQGRRKK